MISLPAFQGEILPLIQQFEDPAIPPQFQQDVDLSFTDALSWSKPELVEDLIVRSAHGEDLAAVNLDLIRNHEEKERPCRLKSVAKKRALTAKELRNQRGRLQLNYIAQMIKDPPPVLPEVPLPPNELILTVALYKPSREKQQEFQVLGSQPLTALRDRLYCLSDYLLDGQQCKSGYFFIEDVFYNDARVPGSLDYSRPILDWVAQNQRFTEPGLGVYSARPMETTRFADLGVRLWHPYLYMHQGSCEHYLVFTDVRVAHPSDIQNVNAYPRHIFQAKIRRRKCGVCDIFPARYVTYRDRLAPEEPFFYCERCYGPLHYDSQGKLLYNDFEVFRYFHE
ncbi:putative snRNA transcription factor [Paratrimastix pyriformis]|uniref:snRNA transcription factor n=1 Tax=Paratrimastix pyriformis TaxID=342808 RepID=A0ABQ8U9M4_9EUKA|nr:putative snRNA transcription factor [Paratrimastix pyriformis]